MNMKAKIIAGGLTLSMLLSVSIIATAPTVIADNDTESVVNTETYVNDKGETVIVTTTTTTTYNSNTPSGNDGPVLTGGAQSENKTTGVVKAETGDLVKPTTDYPHSVKARVYAPAGRIARLEYQTDWGWKIEDTARLSASKHPANYSDIKLELTSPSKNAVNRTYRISVPETSSHAKIVSKTFKVKSVKKAVKKTTKKTTKKVAKKKVVNITASKKTVKAKAKKKAVIKFKATSSPNARARIQKKKGSKWVTVKTVTLPKKGGTVKVTTPKQKKGNHKYRVVVKSSSKVKSGKIAYITVKHR